MRVLVLGYGNPSRRDDGVGLAVINGLRRRLGLTPLEGNDDGFTDLGRPLDTLFVHQLVPEMAEILAEYDRVIFVDAHVGVYPDVIRRVTVVPGFDLGMVSHHIKPASLLELAQCIYGCAPQAQLVSIRGLDFDFGTDLHPATAGAVNKVVDELWGELMPCAKSLDS